MKRVVLDSSAALGWALASQRTAAADELAVAVDTAFISPAIFALEFRNALLAAERNRRMSPAEADAFIADVAEDLVTIDTADHETHRRVVALSRATHLSFYDACYLELAIRENAALASRDAALLAAVLCRSLQAIDLR